MSPVDVYAFSMKHNTQDPLDRKCVELKEHSWELEVL